MNWLYSQFRMKYNLVLALIDQKVVVPSIFKRLGVMVLYYHKRPTETAILFLIKVSKSTCSNFACSVGILKLKAFDTGKGCLQ